MQNKVITISRQYASGGREIGATLAQNLKLPFYDKDIIELATKQSGISQSFFENQEQNDFLFRDFSCGTVFETPLVDKAFLVQSNVIRLIAQKGPCVIMGRGAAAVLKDFIPSLNVFIYADIETRVERAIKEYGDSPHKIKEHISAIDKKRAAYFKFYTGINGQQMENFHLCINSDIIGTDNAANLIEAAYNLA